MMRTPHTLRALALGLGLAFATLPAMAAEPHGGDHAEEAGGDAHGGDAHGGDAHGGDAHGGDAHGGGHGSHYYTADDDGDGTANWMDGDSELFVLKDLGFHGFNLLCLIGIMWWLGRKPLGDAARERALGIRKELTDSARARDEAYQRHQELVARLDKIQGEVQSMEADAEVESAKEEAKLVERAHAEAKRIGETAERNIRDEASRARNALRRDAIELATKLAEGILTQNVNAADQQALARDFLTSLQPDDSQPSA
jgi:F-type H+-transporting ATPase subunit b